MNSTTLTDDLSTSLPTDLDDANDHSTTSGDCPRCIYANTHSWWGPGSRSHCRECHYEWNGTNECHCAACHEHFSSPRAFDFHQTEDGCRDPRKVLRQDGRPRFVETTNTQGRTVWQAPRYDDRVRPWSSDSSAD
jgi:hypothetical protein